MVVGSLTATGNGKWVIFLLWTNGMVECMGEWTTWTSGEISRWIGGMDNIDGSVGAINHGESGVNRGRQIFGGWIER